MSRLTISTLLLAAAIVLNPLPSTAQNMPPLSVSPSKVSMLVGETRDFRAVGKDGRIRHNVAWSVTPAHAVTLTNNGDEVSIKAEEISSTVILTANADGDSAEANIEILSGNSRKSGTVLWSVNPIPGCKSINLVQAVPSANGPDLYDQEECPQGSVVRALTSDGREFWRRSFGGPGAPMADLNPGGMVKPPQRLDPHKASVCDSVSAGMTRENVAKALADRSLRLDDKQRSTNQWLVEEEGFHCTISFDAGNGTVVKKKKTVVTD